VKFDITIYRLNIRGYLFWYDAEDGDFGLSLWFSRISARPLTSKGRFGFAPSGEERRRPPT
jgi:hypothetical protein